MEKFDLDVLGFNVAVTPVKKGEFDIVVTECIEKSGPQLIDQFRLTGYHNEDYDTNWDQLIEEDANREPFLKAVIELMDSE